MPNTLISDKSNTDVYLDFRMNVCFPNAIDERRAAKSNKTRFVRSLHAIYLFTENKQSLSFEKADPNNNETATMPRICIAGWVSATLLTKSGRIHQPVFDPICGISKIARLELQSSPTATLVQVLSEN